MLNSLTANLWENPVVKSSRVHSMNKGKGECYVCLARPPLAHPAGLPPLPLNRASEQQRLVSQLANEERPLLQK
jgi:hypothetical protein